LSTQTFHFTYSQFKELLEKIFLGLLKKAKRGDSLYLEYIAKEENELRYQVLSPMNEDKLKQYIDIHLVQEQDLPGGSNFFFDAFPDDIESIRIIENTRYNPMKAYHKVNDSEVEFNIDSRGILRKSKSISNDVCFHFIMILIA
jgi:hypothetical protein